MCTSIPLSCGFPFSSMLFIPPGSPTAAPEATTTTSRRRRSARWWVETARKRIENIPLLKCKERVRSVHQFLGRNNINNSSSKLTLFPVNSIRATGRRGGEMKKLDYLRRFCVGERERETQREREREKRNGKEAEKAILKRFFFFLYGNRSFRQTERSVCYSIS